MRILRASSIMLLSLGTLVGAAPDAGAVSAFPGAEGYGADSVGGRGGQTYVVRSLCDYHPAQGGRSAQCPDYEDTLRWAVEQSHPRTVVFDVGGNIVLKHPLYIQAWASNLTIAGQTAPSPGVTLSPSPDDDGMSLIEIQSAHDVVIRHIRLRAGASLGKWENHAIFVNAFGGPQPYNIIFDHVSASWATDDLVGFQDVTDATVQWSILSESLFLDAAQVAQLDADLCAAQMAGNPNVTGCYDEGTDQCIPCSRIGGVGKGMLIDYNPNVANPYTGRISVHHNLFAHHFLRTPQAAAGAVSTAPDLPYPLEIVNNVIHDVARHAVMIMDGACGPDLDEICDPALSCVCAASSGTGGTSTLWRKHRVNLVGNTFSLSAETSSILSGCNRHFWTMSCSGIVSTPISDAMMMRSSRVTK
jgi:hypothetical protein